MDSSKFFLDDNNLFLEAAYENDNYKIINGLSGDTCIVFCSGNGLYFPNELEVFKEKIICNDRYEWAHVAMAMIHCVKKIIFIRDVRKNFYVTGINRKINCIDKLIEFLKSECGEEYKTIVVGNSAGGYLASIIGAKLLAQAVFNFSGQWNLYGHGNVIKDSYYLNKFADSKIHNKYFDISQLVKDSGVPIFYFYPQKSETDIKQEEYIHNIRNIYSFAFDSNKHGQGLSTTGYIRLFMSDNEMLKNFSNSYHGILLDPDRVEHLFNKFFPSEEVFRDIARVEKDKVKKKQLLSDKHLALFKMMSQWVKVKQEGKNLVSILEKNGYNKIAIYGMSYAGEALIRELEGTNVQVVYGIDKNAISISADIDVVTMEDNFAEVDAVVVTAIYFFEDIKNNLMSKIDCPVISLEDIVYEV